MDREVLAQLEMPLLQAQTDMEKLKAMLALVVDYFQSYGNSNKDQKLYIAWEYPFNKPYAEIAEDMASKIEISLNEIEQSYNTLFEAYKKARIQPLPPTGSGVGQVEE